MLEMVQFPQPDNWSDFGMLQAMNNGACLPPTYRMLQHQYGTGGHPVIMKIQAAAVAPDIVPCSAYGAPPDPNFADAVDNGWQATPGIPIQHNSNIYEPPPSGGSLAHASSFQDGPTAAAITTTNYPLSQSTGYPLCSAHRDNYSPDSETASTTTPIQDDPACYDWGPSPTTQQRYCPAQERQSAHLPRNPKMAIKGLKEMERSLRADTRRRIRQVKQSLPR
jgi:hypothetical protein